MNTKKHGKSLHHDVFAAYPLVETLISIGISVTLLSVFFFSTINVYKIYDRPEADLKAKSIDVMERLVAFPGQDSSDNLGWEDDPGNISILGLKATPTVAYGIIYVDPNTGEVIPIEGQYTFSDGDIGVADQCFIAGTRVLMADGSHKNIEHINIGDMVTSYDVQTGEFVAGRVMQVFQDPPETMLSNYYLVINNNLRVTPDHLMFSNGKWIPAGDLSIGDCLFSRTHNTEYHVYSIERVYERVTTFNLEIERFHTYFVSIDDDVDVLVHNPPSPPQGKQDINVLYPAEGETLILGSSYSIQWEFTVEGIFDIELYEGESGGLDHVIINGYDECGPGSCSYPWTVSANGPGSYRIKIINTKSSSEGWSKKFSIEENPHPETCTLEMIVDPTDGGGTDPPVGTHVYNKGDPVTITAEPNPGWEFTSWSGDVPTGHEIDNPLTITMDADKTITAHFTQLSEYTLTITIDPAAGGSVAKNPSPPYHYGDEVTLTATPKTGYIFDRWSGNASGTSPTTTITMNEDKIVTAKFIDDSSYSGIHAEFVWFDADGVGPGRKIFFDASKSVEGKNGKTWYTWWWNWTENKNLKQSGTDLKTVMYTYPDEQPHTVRLQVNDSSNNHSCIYIVQVNTFQKPNIEPWTEHDMETFPENDDQTTATYDKGYYVTYTNLDNNYRLYEIKEKTGSPYTILDYKKISSLNNVTYYTAKSALGLNTSDYAAYNFNISISDYTGVIFSYGASYTPSSVKASTSIIREVLIYYSPEAQKNGFEEWTINKHPKYEKAQITVRIFLGGIPPE